ncbi:MAG: DinB family protein [Candidatus Promineifilaceae bacterium]
MDYNYCLKQLAGDMLRIRLLAQGVDDEQARWRPDADSWSILEVICHLLDEERKDFRVRLDITLHKPDETWPGIDPAGWVTEHNYNEQVLAASLQAFQEEREASLAWLKRLEAPDWEASYEAPWGTMRAGDLLASWVAHDLLHMRQLVELHWAYNEQKVLPYSTRYAGEW